MGVFNEFLRQCFQSRQAGPAQPPELSHFRPEGSLNRGRSIQRYELPLNGSERTPHANRIVRTLAEPD